MGTKEASNQTQEMSKMERKKLSQFLKKPIKILIKARDFYIRSMMVYSGPLDYAMTVSCPVGQVATTLPKSFSVNSSKSTDKRDQHYNDHLRRASSTRSYGNKFDNLDSNQRQHVAGPITRKSPSRTVLSGGSHLGPDNIPRSRSVGIGRIDEEKECEFGEVKVSDEVYPRSRSYSVSRRTGKL